MKSFLVLYNKKQPHLLNPALLNDHVNYLKELDSQGVLMLCGPLTNNEQAMFYIQIDSLDEAQQLILKDPFIQEKYYSDFSISEFLPANPENDWLMSSPQTINNLSVSVKKPAENNPGFCLMNNQPQSMAVLFRKLKTGQSYENFRQAWLPPVSDPSRYFGMPVLTINAYLVDDPAQIISIGLIWESPEEAIKKYSQYEKTEEIRHERIEKVTDQSAETRFCKIIDIDILG